MVVAVAAAAAADDELILAAIPDQCWLLCVYLCDNQFVDNNDKRF